MLLDPYTGTVIRFRKADADAVEIDHVPFAIAWDLSASRWTQQQRVDYPNDPTLVLLAVERAANQLAKSDDWPGGVGAAGYGLLGAATTSASPPSSPATTST